MSEFKEQLIELFENVSGCSIDEFSEEQLPYLADYIIGQQEADNMCIEKLKKENQRLTADMKNAISLMSPSWQHAAEKEPDLMTRYVTMAENQFNKKNEEIERLTAIATKHATRADELYEVLECVCSYLSEDGLITTGLAKEIVNAQMVLYKSRIEAEGD
jgi:rubrerythrin